MAASEPRREWTQADILGETMKRHARDVGLFNALADVTDEAFGGALNHGPGPWQFPMGNLTVGDLLDFCAGHTVQVDWHDEAGGPRAYVLISDYGVAQAFRNRFKVNWLAPDEEEARAEEDTLRATGWRPQQ